MFASRSDVPVNQGCSPSLPTYAHTRMGLFGLLRGLSLQGRVDLNLNVLPVARPRLQLPPKLLAIF